MYEQILYALIILGLFLVLMCNLNNVITQGVTKYEESKKVEIVCIKKAQTVQDMKICELGGE